MDFRRLDIVQLINNSSLSELSLSNESNTKLLNKIEDSFTDNEQHLFVGNFYTSLNYNSKTDFVIKLNDVWKWCGFVRKSDAKRLLEKHFINEVDYKKFSLRVNENPDVQVKEGKNSRGSYTKESIIMTINTFKKLCLKAGNEKSDEIHNYYMKLEELMKETLNP